MRTQNGRAPLSFVTLQALRASGAAAQHAAQAQSSTTGGGNECSDQADTSTGSVLWWRSVEAAPPGSHRGHAQDNTCASLRAERASWSRHKLSRISEAVANDAVQSPQSEQLFWHDAPEGGCARVARDAADSGAEPSLDANAEAHSGAAEGCASAQASAPPKASASCAAAERAARRRRGRRMLACGEALHVARPLVYVAMLRRWGRRSWMPWLASLACDLCSHTLTARGLALLQEVRLWL